MGGVFRCTMIYNGNMNWGKRNMYLGKNIQYLRKQRKITQEGFSEQMAVSRQTIAKWEAGDAIPELEKLLEICDFFSCKLDELVRESLSENESIYSEIKVQTVKPFKILPQGFETAYLG